MTEEVLEPKNELLEVLVDSIPVMLVIYDPSLRRFNLNRNAQEVLGWTNADANEGDFMAKVYPNPEYRAMVAAFMTSLTPTWRTLLAMTKQDELIPTEWTNIRLSDDRMVGIGMDLRERKQAEDRILHQNTILSALASIFRKALTCETEEEFGQVCLSVIGHATRSAFGFIGELNLDTGLMDVIALSDPGWKQCRMQETSGHGKQSLYGFSIHGLYGRVLVGGTSFFTNHPASHSDSVGTPPNHPELTSFLGVPLVHAGRVVGMIAMANREDGYGPEEQEVVESLAPAITQAFLYKRAEKKGAETEERMQLAADAAGICAWDVDLETGKVMYSDSASKVFGVEKLGEAFYTMHSFQSCISEEDRPRVKRHIEEAIRETGVFAHQFRFRADDPMWIESRGKVIYDAEGNPLRMLGIAQNITRRKRMEKELHDHRKRLELLVRKRTEELEASRARAQSEADKRQYLAKRLVDILEEDRRDLSMMLHDDIGQRIIGAKMKVESIQGKMSDAGSAESGELGCVVEDLQAVIGSLRDKSRQLLPPSLLLLGLIPSLRSLGDGLTDPCCRMHYFFRDVPEDLEPDMQLALYRIAQEAVINAVRHSGCSEIHLSLTFREYTLRLNVEDDGCGFEWKDSGSGLSDRGPLGLVIMRERAHFIGGDLFVESSPGHGTLVMAEVPVRQRRRHSKTGDPAGISANRPQAPQHAPGST